MRASILSNAVNISTSSAQQQSMKGLDCNLTSVLSTSSSLHVRIIVLDDVGSVLSGTMSPLLSCRLPLGIVDVHLTLMLIRQAVQYYSRCKNDPYHLRYNARAIIHFPQECASTPHPQHHHHRPPWTRQHEPSFCGHDLDVHLQMAS